MIVYSNKAKPLADKVLKEMDGCSVVLIADKTYYTKKKCGTEYLSKIHERGWPYMLAKSITRNETYLNGALNPRYVAFGKDADAMIVGKQIIGIGDYIDIDGVMYSNDKWNKELKLITNENDYNQYDERTRNLITMGTPDYMPMYQVWRTQEKRWYYSGCNQERKDFTYPQFFITREGFLNWNVKPDLYTMKLTQGKTNKDDLNVVCKWGANEIAEIQNLIKINGCENMEEYEEYRMQMCSVWLLVETCKNLCKAQKKIDKDNLSVIIDMIKVSSVRNLGNTTLPQYMHLYLKDILALVE